MNKLQAFLRRVFGTDDIIKEMQNVSREMDHLAQEVAQAKSVMASATTLITTLAGQIRANATDPVALEALAADLDSSAAALASAVTENTPAANIGTSEGTTGDLGGGEATGGTETDTGGTDTGGDDTTGGDGSSGGDEAEETA